MTEVVIILVALLPAIVLWVHIWRKDSQPEPTSQVIKAVLYGIVCVKMHSYVREEMIGRVNEQ